MTAKALTTKKIRVLLNRDSHSEMTTSDVFELFLQVSLVLLIIFIMMNLMFRAKAKAEVEEAKGKLTEFRDKMEIIMTTEPGQMYEKMEKSIIELQRQKLLTALNEVENQDRAEIGLAMFAQRKEGGQVEFNVAGVLQGARINNSYFSEGCRYAKKHLPFQSKMAIDWLKRVLIIAGLELALDSVTIITKNSQVVNKANEQWLKEEINKRLITLSDDTSNMQRAVIARLQKYYRQNPDALKNTEVYGLVKRFIAATPEQKGELVGLLVEGLYAHAKSVFENQNVPLLSQV